MSDFSMYNNKASSSSFLLLLLSSHSAVSFALHVILFSKSINFALVINLHIGWESLGIIRFVRLNKLYFSNSVDDGGGNGVCLFLFFGSTDVSVELYHSKIITNIMIRPIVHRFRAKTKYWRYLRASTRRQCRHCIKEHQAKNNIEKTLSIFTFEWISWFNHFAFYITSIYVDKHTEQIVSFRLPLLFASQDAVCWWMWMWCGDPEAVDWMNRT